MHITDLVADAPQEYRRMIPIPHHEIADIPLRKIFKLGGVDDIRFSVIFVKYLIENQQSHPVAKIQ